MNSQRRSACALETRHCDIGGQLSDAGNVVGEGVELFGGEFGGDGVGLDLSDDSEKFEPFQCEGPWCGTARVEGSFSAQSCA